MTSWPYLPTESRGCSDNRDEHSTFSTLPYKQLTWQESRSSPHHLWADENLRSATFFDFGWDGQGAIRIIIRHIDRRICPFLDWAGNSNMAGVCRCRDRSQCTASVFAVRCADLQVLHCAECSQESCPCHAFRLIGQVYHMSIYSNYSYSSNIVFTGSNNWPSEFY